MLTDLLLDPPRSVLQHPRRRRRARTESTLPHGPTIEPGVSPFCSMVTLAFGTRVSLFVARDSDRMICHPCGSQSRSYRLRAWMCSGNYITNGADHPTATARRCIGLRTGDSELGRNPAPLILW